MAFYVLFAACLGITSAWRSVALCIVLGTSVLLGWITNAQGIYHFYTDAIILTFGTGVLLGELYCRKLVNIISTSGGAIIILFGIGLWILGQTVEMPHRFVAAGIPATLVVLGAISIPSLASSRLKWLESLGNASYSIYLGHILLLGALRYTCNRANIIISNSETAWTYMLSALIISAVGGWLIFRHVESPIAKGSTIFTRGPVKLWNL